MDIQTLHAVIKNDIGRFLSSPEGRGNRPGVFVYENLEHRHVAAASWLCNKRGFSIDVLGLSDVVKTYDFAKTHALSGVKVFEPEADGDGSLRLSDLIDFFKENPGW